MFYQNDYDSEMTYKKREVKGFSAGVNSDIERNILPMTSSAMSYNFDYEDGALRDGMGVKILEFRSSEDFPDEYKIIGEPDDNGFEIGCWFFSAWTDEIKIHRPFIIVYTTKGNFYYNRIHSDIPELIQIEGLNFTEKPIVAQYKLNGVDTLILVSEADGMYTWQFPYKVTKIENAPSISSMCVHNDRLFVTTQGEKRTIMFSDNLDPTNFNISLQEGGIIELADEFGTSNKVISFEGYVYIFRNFNIAKLTTYSDKNDFSVSQLYVSNGRIYEKTVCICGNKILYLATDGVYVFDGSKATKMDLKINNLFKGTDNVNAVAGYSNGYYYLSCNLNYGDDDIIGNENSAIRKRNSALLKINVSTGSMSIMRGYDVVDISVINDIYKSEVCVVMKENTGGYSMGLLENTGKYFDTPITKVWKSAFSDFGYPEKVKIVKEVTFETKQNIILQVVTEDGEKSFEVTGKSGYQTIKPYVKGKKIAIGFKSEATDNYISNLKITVGYL